MNVLLFTSVFFVFGIVYLIIGLYASKGISSIHDYFLAGKNLGIISVTFTLIATQLGSGMLLGTPQKAYESGLFGVFYILGMSLGLIILACGVAAKLQSMHVATTAEIFEKKYSSIFLKQVASLLSIVTLCGILVAQVVAIKSVITSIGFDNELIFVLFWLFIVAYTMLGGLKAVVLTDVFQVIFIIIVFFFLALYFVITGPKGFISNVIMAHKTGIFKGGMLGWSQIYSVIIVTTLFSLIEQDLAQRFFAAKSRAVAVFSSLYASIFLICFAFIPLYFGICAKLSGTLVPTGANPLVLFLNNNTGELVFVFVLCGIVAAITSTADSMLCAISSNIAQDFNCSIFKNFNKITLSKIITFIVGVAALLLSYVMPKDNIIGIIVFSYNIMVSCLFVSTIFALFKKSLCKEAAIFSVSSGAITFLLFKMINLGILSDILPLIVSFIAYIIGMLWCEKKN